MKQEQKDRYRKMKDKAKNNRKRDMGLEKYKEAFKKLSAE